LRQSGVIPLRTYEDVDAAAEWLVRAFGFRAGERHEDESGQVIARHLDAGDGDSTIVLGWVGPGYHSPRRHRETCQASREWQETVAIIDGVAVFVDDVDAHCERARSAGARILSEPEDSPFGRRYRAEDAEGQRWMFLQG
jgi:uncharacterized glyoxalase superfamily protein PhnB